MARIKLSPILTDIRGKLGQGVFQASRTGLIIRQASVKRKVATAEQLRIRSLMVNAQNLWKSLNSIERKSWEDYISFVSAIEANKRERVLNAYETFIRWQMLNSSTLKHTTIRTTSLVVGTFSVVQLELARVSETLLLTTEFSISGYLANTPIYISRGFPVSRYIAESELRYITGAADVGSGVNIASAYKSVYPNLPESGEKVLVKLTAYSPTSGWVAKPYIVEVLVS